MVLQGNVCDMMVMIHDMQKTGNGVKQNFERSIELHRKAIIDGAKNALDIAQWYEVT